MFGKIRTLGWAAGFTLELRTRTPHFDVEAPPSLCRIAGSINIGALIEGETS